MSFENNKATYEAPVIDIYDFLAEDVMTNSTLGVELGDNEGGWNTNW